MADTAFSSYYENLIVNHMLRGVAFTVPTNVYVALFTAVTNLEINAPTAEVTTTNSAYARQICALNAPVSGVTENSANITFPEATADWGTISAMCLADHATNVTWGTNVNVLIWGALTTNKVINSADTFKFNAGDIDITVD